MKKVCINVWVDEDVKKKLDLIKRATLVPTSERIRQAIEVMIGKEIALSAMNLHKDTLEKLK